MNWFTFVLFVILSLKGCSGLDDLGNLTSPCTDRNHIFLVPGVLNAGGNNRACISRFFYEGPAIMTLSLHTEDNQVATATRELPNGDGGCVDIAVPLLPNSKADLIVNIRYPELKCTWERRLSLTISSGKVVAVHTEKVRYRPGEVVRARVFVLKADLTPVHGNIEEVWLEAPGGPRAAVWSRVRMRLGIAHIQKELDELAPVGKWLIRARMADGSQGAAAFRVGNYELPPFHLTVHHMPRVLRTSERLVWTVCVRYPWSEAVEGMLVIRIRGSGGRRVSDSPGIRTAVRLRGKACHRHAAAARRVGFDAGNLPDVVVADFSFQEDGTRIWQNTTVVSQVVEQPITLEFVTRHRTVIAPGLPYILKIKATRWNDKPASDETIKVCHSPVTNDAVNAFVTSCNDAITDEKGVAKISVIVDDEKTAYHKFEASVSNTSTSLTLPVHRSSSVATFAPLSISDSATTLLPLYVRLKTISRPLTVHFVVITRGGTIFRWGATTQCPSPITYPNFSPSPRHSLCPHSSGLLRVLLPIRVTHQMCPESNVVAYFYQDGELVSASKRIETEDCFGSKVSLSWPSRAAPGSHPPLTLNTGGTALCALQATRAPHSWGLREALMKSLKRLIDGRANLTVYQAQDQCFLIADSPNMPSSGTELTSSWLAAAGVRMLGVSSPKNTRCEAAEPLVDDDVTVPRSDFSETWLWRLVPISSNGSAQISARAPDSITRYEASAVCVSKSGIALSRPAAIQIFREFFIHADCPNRLRRGDSAIIIYRVFNYLYEPLSVQIQLLTDPHLSVPDHIESSCIPPRSSISRRVSVEGALVGHGRLSVRARSVADGMCGNTSAQLSDEVILQVEVEPEGFPIREQKSMMLCGKDSRESTSSVSWSWPAVDSVPGTETLTVWTAGDLTAPLLADADSLVQLPRGCGEQNLARLAANTLAARRLQAGPSAAVAREHVARGFARQLQYVHPSGGFSAFGASDLTASTWLTAFAVRYMRTAHEIVSPQYPIPAALERAERWLMSQQMENGCFRNEGQVFHREFKGGLNADGELANVALTAYVITSLIENSIILPSKLIRSTKSCLRAFPLKSKSKHKVYAQSLLSYALTRMKKYEEELSERNEASLLEKNEGVEEEEGRSLSLLLRMAKRSEDMVWWETDSLSTSIEATGYAILSLINSGSSRYTSDIAGSVRWLTTHINPTGGFVSTQDTLIALEALLSWSSSHSNAVNLTVTVQSGNTIRAVKLNPTVRVPEVFKMGDGHKLSVVVEGSGCALLQATRSYNSYTVQSTPNTLSVHTAVTTDGQFNCDDAGANCFCAAVIEVCVVWSGEFPEMSLLEVTLPGGYSALSGLLYQQLHENTLLRRIEITPNNNRATLYLASRDATTLGPGHQCFDIYTVGAKGRTKPSTVTVLDYYRPSDNDTRMFTIPEDCPPRISHETSDYMPSDNLFNKAKSLNNDGELIITDEVSFDDIPDGIPLEDPLFDSLAIKDMAEKPDDSGKTDLNEHDTMKVNDSIINVLNIESKRNTDNVNADGKTLDNIINSTSKPYLKPELDNEILKSDKLHTIEIRNDVKQDSDITKHRNIENGTDTENNYGFKTLETSNDTVKTASKSGNLNNKNPESISGVDNPNLSGFHVIDSDKDLEVPKGVEGPIAAVVMAPQGFVAAPSEKPYPGFQPRSHLTQYTSLPYETYYVQPIRSRNLQHYQLRSSKG